MKHSKDKKFVPDKYNACPLREKLSQDFTYIASWMSKNGQSATTLANHIRSSAIPRRSIAESETLVTDFNNVIDFCNTALTSPQGSEKRTNARLRTAIRRIEDFTATITDALDCQNHTYIHAFIR